MNPPSDRGCALSFRSYRAALLFALALPLLSCSTLAQSDKAAQVRSLLSDYCFQCHGPDENTRATELRLDLKEAAFADLGGYTAIVPKNADASELLRRIESDDPDTVMPPPDSKISLSTEQKDLLRSWIDEGAEWSEHWAFIPPRTPEIPQNPAGWSRGPIDEFIYARAMSAGLSPSPAASRETLIRRLTLDLTGLPPTPAEVDNFLQDSSPDAYEQLVDRLLASPRYGERMAWDWLNAARYADTDGFQGDPTRTMWPWRDWLVNALNENVPFDQLTTEMLAGDLLPNATPEQILATGFHRNHMFNGEGGRIPEETRVENVFDRAETTGTVWLGLTMTCCRCHDHKFDPVSQEEYFRFYAFFNNTSETGRSGRGKTAPLLQYLAPEKRKERGQRQQQLAEVQAKMAAPQADLDAAQRDWERELQKTLATTINPTTLGPWQQLGPIPMDGRKAFDQSIGDEPHLTGDTPIGEHQWREANVQDGTVYDLPDTVGPTFFARTLNSSSARSIRLSFGSDDAIKVYLNGKQIVSRFAARAAAADQEVVDASLEAGDNHLLVKIVNTGGIGGFYFRLVSESAAGVPVTIAAAVKTPGERRSSGQQAEIRNYYRKAHWAEWPALQAKLDRLQKQIETIDRGKFPVMVMDALPVSKRRKTVILERGGYDKPTDVEVTAGTPDFLPPLVSEGEPDRLALARWITDPQNPLTARVTVNRFWQLFFGRGIVETSEDFGEQGAKPSHPALLDYLAIRFRDNGWNMKALHKEIVMSAAYRQSSHILPQARDLDPENRLLARAPRFRLPSWMLRDQALAVSGLMNGQLGGPPVKPYQPDGIWAEATFGKIRYQPDQGDAVYRRSLYVFWRRIVGPTMFFDEAKRQTCEVKPTRTNTPLHALTTLNETLFFESARKMAERVLTEHSTTNTRLRSAFRLATARQPDERERTILQKQLDSFLKDFDTHPDEAEQLLAVGSSPTNPDLDVRQHAAWTLLCSTLLNLDETLTRH